MVCTPWLSGSVLSVLADRSASTSAAPTAITLGANSMSRVWSARRSASGSRCCNGERPIQGVLTRGQGQAVETYVLEAVPTVPAPPPWRPECIPRFGIGRPLRVTSWARARKRAEAGKEVGPGGRWKRNGTSRGESRTGLPPGSLIFGMIRVCCRVEMGLWLWLLLATTGCGSASDAERDLFCYNASDGIRSLDPAKATDLETMWVVDQLYEGLLELDADLRVIPALAEAWSVSDDGLVTDSDCDATFRRGHLTDDVVASLERLRDPSKPCRDVGCCRMWRTAVFGLWSRQRGRVLTRPIRIPSLLATPQAVCCAAEHG